VLRVHASPSSKPRRQTGWREAPRAADRAAWASIFDLRRIAQSSAASQLPTGWAAAVRGLRKSAAASRQRPSR